MTENGSLLVSAGYGESRRKPNLFWRHAGKVRFFADMRGTVIVPIWEDPRPLLYLFPERGTDLAAEDNARLLSEEQGRLYALRVHTRFNFYQESCDETMWDKPQIRLCVCNKEFFGAGEYCSDKCKLAATKASIVYMLASAPFCSVCKRKVVDEWVAIEAKAVMGVDLASKVVVHHLSYAPEITAEVCQECHQRIHARTAGLEGWSNIDKRPAGFRSKRPPPRQASL
jgi:hypothetical protein